jgi:hypothetical protein
MMKRSGYEEVEEVQARQRRVKFMRLGRIQRFKGYVAQPFRAAKAKQL